MHDIRWTDGAKEDMALMKLRAFDIRRIIDHVDEQLTHEPERETRHKKVIRPDVELGFEHLEPVWQLSVGEFRVFYDVAAKAAEEPGLRIVSIRAIRRKTPHRTTEEIL
jgi:hypothetical protein